MIDPSVLAVALSPVLTAAVLGWYVREQRRNNKHNPGNSGNNPGYLEDTRECVRAEAKDTRKAIHELHEKLGTEANRIIEAIREGKG